MRARHARRRRPLLRARVVNVYNGVYPHRVLLEPVLTWREVRRRIVGLATALPLAVLLGVGLTALLLGADPIVDLSGAGR